MHGGLTFPELMHSLRAGAGQVPRARPERRGLLELSAPAGHLRHLGAKEAEVPVVLRIAQWMFAVA